MFDSFLEMTINMTKEYVSDTNSKQSQVVNSGVLDDLKKYNTLLFEIKSDIKRKKGIF